MNRRYLVAVALLAVFALVFGAIGTVAPPLAEEAAPVQPQQESSSDSVAHFMYPPSYDSGWVDIATKNGQYFALRHGLNTTEAFVDVSGKQSLDPTDVALAWSKNYGGTEDELAYSLVQTIDGDFALAGYNSSGGYDFCLVKADPSGVIEWSRNYGGAGYEGARSMIQTSDGGYALAGWNYSTGTEDFCLVKVDPAGNLQWSKSYESATGDEGAFSLVQTFDGGYVLAGYNYTIYHNYDFCLAKVDSAGNLQWIKSYGIAARSEVSFSMLQAVDGGYALAGLNYSTGNYDFCLVKTDSSGNLQWSKNYGTATDSEEAHSMIQTSDGEYILAGYNTSGVGNTNFCLVKLDSDGNLEWSRNYGGTDYEEARSVVQTIDGGYALAGYNSSGSYDFCLVKTDSAGNFEWSRNYGGANMEEAVSLVQTSDGGYALAGYTYSYGVSRDFWLVKVRGEMGKEHKKYFGGTNLIPGWTGAYGGTGFEFAFSVVQTNDGGYALAGLNISGVGNYNFCLVKVDSDGNLQWSKNYGGTEDEVAYSVVQTFDCGYALAGYNSSGGLDFCLVKTDSAGNLEWSRNYGTVTNTEDASSLVQTLDGGYALTGRNYSSNSDFCLVKVDSSGVMEWSKNYGKAGQERAYSLVQTFDCGYALAGYNSSGGYDFCLVKADSSGVMEWSKNYGGAGSERAYPIVQTSDGGYALAGYTNSFGVGGDFWLVKAGSSGNMQWNRNYGGAADEEVYSLVQTSDGGYALGGYTYSFGVGGDFWLVKTDVEMGLALTDVAKDAITLYRGKTDLYWNYVRVRIWTIKEPSWIYGDLNMDGIVDAKDLYIIGRNYGKTFSLLSLSGIIAVAGVRTVKKRKQNKQPSYIS